MLFPNISSIRAFGKTASGNYELLDMSKVKNAGATLKSQREALALLRADYVSRIDGDSEAKIGVTAKGQDIDTGEVQFAPNADVLTAIDAIISALQTAETSVNAVDFPTA